MLHILFDAERTSAELESHAIQMKFNQIFAKKKSEPTLAEMTGPFFSNETIDGVTTNLQRGFPCTTEFAKNTLPVINSSFHLSYNKRYIELISGKGVTYENLYDEIDSFTLEEQDELNEISGWWSLTADYHFHYDDAKATRSGDICTIEYRLSDFGSGTPYVNPQAGEWVNAFFPAEGQFRKLIENKANTNAMDSSGICATTGTWKLQTYKDAELSEPTTMESEIVRAFGDIVEDPINCPKPE